MNLPEQLDDALVRAGWADPGVSDLRRLTGGASRETWSFTARRDAGPDAAAPPRVGLILQRERPGGIRTGGGMAAEAVLLRAAARAGVPVPEVVATDADGADLGAPFVIARAVAGETIPRKLLRDDAWAGVRPTLARRAGEALARIHSVPLHDVADVLVRPDQLVQFRDLLDALGATHPAFELGMRWLEHHPPPSRPDTLVHGDFRTGNLVIDGSGLAAVLDWELAHLGDPVEDLGWFCVRAWRFGSPARAGGFGPVEELLDGYRRVSGVDVGLDELRWWETMGTLKWGVMCIVQAATHLNGLSRSVELAVIGRRVCENELDLLRLIAPAARPGPPSSVVDSTRAAPDDPGLHGRPTVTELLDAVREFLAADVTDATDGRVRYLARVAGNALAIVERELADRGAMAARHADRLESLGFAGDSDLAAAIRSGSLDDRWDRVVDSVLGSVRDKVAVANPGHLEDPPPG